MKIAIMQPYIFPYIGYFQMINAVDKFVLYDDVNFIKQGWINRNRILVSGGEFLFTVPLDNANSFCMIKDTKVNGKMYEKWRLKFMQTIDQNYRKAPHFKETKELVDSILTKQHSFISELAIDSIVNVAKYLNIETEFLISSKMKYDKELERQDRLVNICKEQAADHYINASGGQLLYKKEDFLKEGIKLDFIKPLPVKYKQFKNDFIPALSIVDVLMFNSKEQITEMLEFYELV